MRHLCAPPLGVTSVSSDAVVVDEGEIDATAEEFCAVRRSAKELIDECWPVLVQQPTDSVYTVDNFDAADLVAARALAKDPALLNPDPSLDVPARFVVAYHTRAATARKAAYDAALLASGAAAGSSSSPVPALPIPVRKRAPDAEPGGRRPPKRRKVEAQQTPADPPSPIPRPSRKNKRRGTKRGKAKAKGPKKGEEPDVLAPPDIQYETSLITNASKIQTSAAQPLPASFPAAATLDLVPVPFDLAGLTYDPAKAALVTPATNLPPLPKGKKVVAVLSDEEAKERKEEIKAHNASRVTAVVYPRQDRASSSSTPAVALESLKHAASGYSGHIPRTRIKQLLTAWGTPALTPLLAQMHVVPDNGVDTAICDRNGRCVVFRSTPCFGRKDEDLMAQLCADVRRFVERCPVNASDRLGNSRGHHYAGCLGVHRQYTALAKETAFHRRHKFEAEWLMRPNGPLAAYLKILNGIMATRFGKLYERMKACVNWHVEDCAERGQPINPLFSPWLNCCINAASPEVGVERVTTRPHGDTRNISTFYCALLTYWDDGWLGEHEWSYIALWELGMILSCTRGAWVIYPSALLLHFNVRIVKCKKGEMPTPQNTEELPMQGKSRRGSIVFFTQSTMISVTDEKSRNPNLAKYEKAVAECFPEMIHMEPLIEGVP